MRILLDENVPSDLARELGRHDVRTVQRMGWSGIQNGALLRRAAREFDAFVTFDRSIQHQQVLPQGLSILILRLPDNKPETVFGVTGEILSALAEMQPGTVVQVFPH